MATPTHDPGATPPAPGRGALRAFGLQVGGAVALVFGVLGPWLTGHPWPAWPWVIAAVLGSLALVAPAALGPAQRGWMLLGNALHRVTSPLVLILVFALVFIPAALVLRLLRRDTLARRLSATARSYRVASARHPASHMERPF